MDIQAKIQALIRERDEFTAAANRHVSELTGKIIACQEILAEMQQEAAAGETAGKQET